MLDKKLLEFDDCFDDGMFVGDFNYDKKIEWEEINRQVHEFINQSKKTENE